MDWKVVKVISSKNKFYSPNIVNMNPSLPRIVVVGTGKMTMKRHLPALIQLQNEKLCQIISVCDINKDLADAARKRFSIPKVFYDAKSAISDKDVDSVFIFGPAQIHYEFGIFALQNGKNLFVEKPPAPSTSQLQEMITLAERKNLVAAVGFNRRFQKNINIIKDKLKPEDINFIEASFYKPFANHSVQFDMSSWIWINGIHAIDTVCYLMGEVPTKIKLLKKDFKNKKVDSSLILFEWNNGVHATITLNNSSGIRLEKYVVHGYGQTCISEGPKLLIANDNDYLETHDNYADSAGGIKEEFLAFFDAIKNGTSPANCLSSALATIKLIELIEMGFEGDLQEHFIYESEKKYTDLDTNLPTNSKPTTKPVVFVLNPKAMSNALTYASNYFDLVFELPTEREKCNEIKAIISGGSQSEVPTEKHFKIFDNLKVVGVIGASVKRWGGDIASKKGIDVINTADTLADPVAEFLLLQVLTGLRKSVLYDSTLKRGGWSLGQNKSIKDTLKKAITKYLPLFLKRYLKKLFGQVDAVNTSAISKGKLTKGLRGKTVSILGFGEITKKAIPLFKACGAEVQVMSEYITNKDALELDVMKVGLAQAAKADIVIVNRGVSDRTIKFFGRNEIMSMKPGAIFVNSARAELVDNQALVERLEKGDIFACIDVFDKEPLPKNNPFRKLENVFITPHIAGSIRHVNGLEEQAATDLISKLIAYFYNNDSNVVIPRVHLKNMT